ncbi:uncharacterized protein LOC110656718 [Hevea brasiliensis]|uniref:uncharacterized protein LOC110656718 n=1 Tax=Hevea brasiliensis TaxID=3981 RepID=UPI0025E7F1F7|nr:uncharacterized protein LOC110656718 [Hevea brasiliensis]
MEANASFFVVAPQIFNGESDQLWAMRMDTYLDALDPIMSLGSTKAIWDYLKEEYQGDERIRGMQVLNSIREFKMQRMKESETIKEYVDKLLSIVNKVRLLGTKFSDSRLVKKILVSIPERFKALISSLENSKDLSRITLAELLNALQVAKQRWLMKQEGAVEGALQAKH